MVHHVSMECSNVMVHLGSLWSVPIFDRIIRDFTCDVLQSRLVLDKKTRVKNEECLGCQTKSVIKNVQCTTLAFQGIVI